MLKRPVAPLAMACATLLIVAGSSGSSACRPLPSARADGPLRLSVEGRSSSAPWIAAQGAFVAVAWGAKPEDAGSDVYVAVSRDEGVTFSAPVRVNTRPGEARIGGEFPPRVALAAKGSGEPDIVVAWLSEVGEITDVRLARSSDGGRTFGPPRVLQQAGAPGSRGWHAMALDGDGVAHALWLDHRGLADPPSDPAAHAGHQGGPAHAETDPMDGVAMALKSGLYYTRDTGETERELIKGVCYCCKTTIAAGPRGALYAAWRQVYPGNIRDIAFTASRDGGRTFDPATRVSPDEWQINGCPDDGPAMAVDTAGAVHVVWPTVTGGTEPAAALFYARSPDGRTFTERQRLPSMGSTKPSHPQLVIGPSGRPVAAWDELHGDRRIAAVARIDVDANGRAVFTAPMTLEPAAFSSYPVLAASATHVIAAWTSGPRGSSTIAVRRLPGGGGPETH